MWIAGIGSKRSWKKNVEVIWNLKTELLLYKYRLALSHLFHADFGPCLDTSSVLWIEHSLLLRKPCHWLIISMASTCGDAKRALQATWSHELGIQCHSLVTSTVWTTNVFDVAMSVEWSLVLRTLRRTFSPVLLVVCWHVHVLWQLLGHQPYSSKTILDIAPLHYPICRGVCRCILSQVGWRRP